MYDLRKKEIHFIQCHEKQKWTWEPIQAIKRKSNSLRELRGTSVLQDRVF